MELLKFYFLFILLIACVFAHPSAEAAHKLKPGQKNKSKPSDVQKKPESTLNRSRRQFGYGGGGFGGSGSFANANAGSSSFGGSPFGFPYGGGFGGSNSFASANAGSSSFSG